MEKLYGDEKYTFLKHYKAYVKGIGYTIDRHECTVYHSEKLATSIHSTVLHKNFSILDAYKSSIDNTVIVKHDQWWMDTLLSKGKFGYN